VSPVTRFPALACSLVPSRRPTLAAVRHLILGSAQEQRLVKRESLLAQASPTYYCLSRCIPHRTCISISILLRITVSRPTRRLRIIAPSSGFPSFPRQATTPTHPIDNPQSAHSNVDRRALASHHPRPLPSPAHIHRDSCIDITWSQTTKRGRIDLHHPPIWSKTSTLRPGTPYCTRTLRN
jgi:hypothetical protein